jgi:hypothetical protein
MNFERRAFFADTYEDQAEVLKYFCYEMEEATLLILDPYNYIERWKEIRDTCECDYEIYWLTDTNGPTETNENNKKALYLNDSMDEKAKNFMYNHVCALAYFN